MKYFVYIIGLIAYIGAFALLTKLIYKIVKHSFKLKEWIILGLIYLFGLFPLFAAIDYLFLLHLPFFEFLASVGFTIAGFLIYFILIIILFGIIVLIYNLLFKKHKINIKSKSFNIISLVIISSLSIGICIFGFVEARAYKIETTYVETNIEDLKIVTLADIHYGTTCSTLNEKKLIEKVNSTNSDIIFLVGDIFDNHIKSMNKDKFTSFINSFSSTYGTYAVLGNHELKQNSFEDAVSFYSKSNVRLLLDEEIIIDNKIRVIGRIDKSYKDRKELSSIDSSSSLPLIVLDHQPSSYKESMEIGASIQYSGHTHNGQLFPYNFIVDIYHKIKYDCPINGTNKYDDFYLIINRGTSNWGFPYKTTGPSQILITEKK